MKSVSKNIYVLRGNELKRDGAHKTENVITAAGPNNPFQVLLFLSPIKNCNMENCEMDNAYFLDAIRVQIWIKLQKPFTCITNMRECGHLLNMSMYSAQ